MELLTIREAAQALKVSSITVRRYVAVGRLPAVKVGKGIRVRREAIDHLLTPVEPKPALAKPRSRVFTQDDTLWNIVGMAKSEGPVDVSENKNLYLAEGNSSQ